MNRRTVLTGFVVLAVFLAGAVTGAAVYRAAAGPGDAGVDASTETASGSGDGAFGPDRRRDGPGERPGGRPGGDGAADDPSFLFGRLLEQELDLSDEQMVEVRAIMERREEEARELFMESRSRFEQLMEEFVAEIETILSEEQAREFRALIESLEERFDDGDDDPF